MRPKGTAKVIEFRCETCGKPFRRKDWQVAAQARHGNKTRFCSHACRLASPDIAARLPPPKTPAQKAETHERRKARKRPYDRARFTHGPERTCPCCGTAFSRRDARTVYCSQACAKRSVPTGWGRKGVRDDLGHFVRSSWEANIARLLKALGIAYVYEPRRFDLGWTTYLPDFEIAGGYIEVVGRMTPRDARQIEDFGRHYPLLVIDAEHYRLIETILGPLVPNWE